MVKFSNIKYSKKYFYFSILLLSLIIISSFLHKSSLTFSPVTEASLMAKLDKTKQLYPVSEFESDGCSGGISKNWNQVINSFSTISSNFNKAYEDVDSITFELDCIEHDRSYHSGEGGYIGRLRADNKLRQAIITYGEENFTEIKERTGLDTDEQAIYLYEVIAEAVYRGVRLGGAPCTVESYAWGYGYNQGNCVE